MGLVWRLRWSFIHMELIVDQCRQGHNLQWNTYIIRSLLTKYLSLSEHTIK